MYRQSAVSSVLYAPLIALAFQMQAGGITGARADDASGALYPGQYVTNCKPAPIVGCVCESDSTGQMPQLPQSTSESRRIRDIEYSQSRKGKVKLVYWRCGLSFLWPQFLRSPR